MPEYVGERFHERQVVAVVRGEQMSAVWDLVSRMTALRYYVAAVAIVEHEWVRVRWAEPAVADDPAKLIERVLPGPVARVAWHVMQVIDRETFSERWLRTVGCGMAYEPLTGPADRTRVEPHHFSILHDVLALFEPSCEIRHSHEEEGEGDVALHPVTGATFDTCFVLRDAKMTGVFAFGEED